MRIGLLHAYDRRDWGVLDNQCVARLAKAASLWHGGKIDRIWITATSKRHGDKLARAMHANLVRAGVPRDKIVITSCGKNTAGEIEGCAERLANGDRVVSISSWYHLPRIWCIWLLRGRLAGLAASGGGDFIDIALEPLKFVYALVKFGRPS